MAWNEHYRRHGEAWRGITKINIDLKGKRVLELGCGTGKTLKAILQRQPAGVIAVDFSEVAVRIAEKKFSKELAAGNCKLKVVRADCAKLPFENNSFNIIFCHHTLGAMQIKERGRCIAEMERVLVKGGKLLFEDFAVGDLREKGVEIEKNTFQKKNGIIQHFFTAGEVRGLFSRFKKVRASRRAEKVRLGKKMVLRAEIIAEATK
jgi:ubiquinone/menaquinone biosynthesis C-methylase UbiE